MAWEAGRAQGAAADKMPRGASRERAAPAQLGAQHSGQAARSPQAAVRRATSRLLGRNAAGPPGLGPAGAAWQPAVATVEQIGHHQRAGGPLQLQLPAAAAAAVAGATPLPH